MRKARLEALMVEPNFAQIPLLHNKRNRLHKSVSAFDHCLTVVFFKLVLLLKVDFGCCNATESLGGVSLPPCL